jgi:hypothetical protein
MARLRLYLSLILWLMLSQLMVGITTMVLHEIGHAFTGVIFDCKEIKVVLLDFERKAGYTEMKCDFFPKAFALIGPFIFALPFAFSFLLLESFQPERYFSLITIGFLLLSIQEDMIIVNLPSSYHIIVQIAGVSILIAGQALVVDSLFKNFLGI